MWPLPSRLGSVRQERTQREEVKRSHVDCSPVRATQERLHRGAAPCRAHVLLDAEGAPRGAYTTRGGRKQHSTVMEGHPWSMRRLVIMAQFRLANYPHQNCETNHGLGVC